MRYVAARNPMKEGGVISSDMCGHPLVPVTPDTRAGLIEIARSLDTLVLSRSR